MTNLHDVALLAHVSDSTASRALRGLEIVKPSTRLRIEKAADTLQFELSRSASALASGKTMRVIMLFSSPLNTWFSACCMQGAYEVLSSCGYDIVPVLLNNTSNANDFFKALPKNKHNIDGIIIPSIRLDSRSSEELRSLEIPTVGLDACTSPVLDASVALDNETAMRTAVQYIHDLGHRTIGYVQYPNPNIFLSSAEERGTFFMQAAQEMAYSNDHIHYYPATHRTTDSSLEDSLARIAQRIVSLPHPPTALCVENDDAAIILMQHLRKLGMRIPDDISIIGFDDNTNAALMGLTTLRQDPVHMARMAATLMLDLMNKTPIKQRQLWLTTTLITRSSSRKTT